MLVHCPQIDRVLDAYGDAELGRVEAREVRDHLDVCPSCRQRAGARESLGRLIRRVQYCGAPDRLRVDVARTWRPARVSPRVLAWAAMVTLAASLGSGTVIRAIRARQAAAATTAIAQDVLASHVQASMEAHLLDAATPPIEVFCAELKWIALLVPVRGIADEFMSTNAATKLPS